MQSVEQEYMQQILSIYSNIFYSRPTSMECTSAVWALIGYSSNSVLFTLVSSDNLISEVFNNFLLDKWNGHDSIYLENTFCNIDKRVNVLTIV